MTEHILGHDHDCWDVHTNKDRYWVITGPTNLYSQHYFPSLDFTLSFHIGVSARIMSLQRGAPSRAHKSRFTPVWRRWEQAAESYDEAEEAEDFQAVGMRCRETLIQFVRVPLANRTGLRYDFAIIRPLWDKARNGVVLRLEKYLENWYEENPDDAEWMGINKSRVVNEDVTDIPDENLCKMLEDLHYALIPEDFEEEDGG